jgi:hypothetical protein
MCAVCAILFVPNTCAADRMLPLDGHEALARFFAGILTGATR